MCSLKWGIEMREQLRRVILELYNKGFIDEAKILDEKFFKMRAYITDINTGEYREILSI
jgi:hypothetical protein